MQQRIILALLGFAALYTVLIFGGLRFIDWLFEVLNDRIDLAKYNKGKPRNKQKKKMRTKKRKYNSFSMKYENPVRWARLVHSVIMVWLLMLILIVCYLVYAP